jgi:LmbE family N-acetylglucosaminyl deacetylase
MELPWKLQSILFSSLRGPDQELLINIKQVSKWMRAVTQQNADPSKPYMNNINLPESVQALAELYKELEHCPCHFVHHFLDGLAIIGYFHPDHKTAAYATALHYDCAEEIFHFVPESPQVFKLRHRDKRSGQDVLADKWHQDANVARTSFMRSALNRFYDEQTDLIGV